MTATRTHNPPPLPALVSTPDRDRDPALNQAPSRTREFEDDEFDLEDFPIPSTWQRGGVVPAERSLFDDLQAATFGFVLGLIIVVPIVLMVTDRMDDVSRAVATTVQALTQPVVEAANGHVRAADPGVAEPRVFATAGTSLPEPQSTIETIAAATVSTPAASASPAANIDNPEVVMMEARSLIASGELAAAQRLLESARASAHGGILFMLAETYDPNVLAAWGERTASPDLERARNMYMLALMAGVDRAKARIEGLQ